LCITDNTEDDVIPTEDDDTEDNIIQNKDEGFEGSDGEDNFDYNINPDTLDNTSIGWSFKRNQDHSPVIGYNEGVDLEKYGAYYKVDTEEKVVYLTFDEGYENGYTPQILDTLKANNVIATFMVTKSYIENNLDLVVRMKEEGHLVGNHSVNHLSLPDLTDEEIEYEIKENERYFEEQTGYEMDTFFRPPEGVFSERTLCLTRMLGYRTIFWSMAYADWDTSNQKGAEYAYNHVMENYHPGAIILLHAVSESNAEALDDIIKSLKEKGYRFGNLYEVE
jgi:peptidoglycan-N-acetylmuramic acid deacetylase